MIRKAVSGQLSAISFHLTTSNSILVSSIQSLISDALAQPKRPVSSLQSLIPV